MARFPHGDPVGRRMRAVARLLAAGRRPREIAELDIGDPGSAVSCPSRPSSMRVAGRKAGVVHLEGAAAADKAAFLDDRGAGHRAVSSDIDVAVAAVSTTAGAKLRAREFRTISAIRIAEATTDEDRQRVRCGLEGPEPKESP